MFWAVRPPWYYKQITSQIVDIGFFSLPVVGLTTFFSGMVLALQTSSGFAELNSETTVARVVLISITRELGPVLTSLMVAGRVGAKMAAEIATMRVTEQIDALEIMGVNSAGYLILPKIIAGLFIVPFLVILSMVMGVGAGAWVGVATGVSSLADFEYGMQVDFHVFDVIYALTKTVAFGFILTSVSAYHGYYAAGGALEVGRSSTRAVVWSVVIIMVTNLILTQMLLN